MAPFVVPFHAAPNDYQRYSQPGLEYLHKDFLKIESGVWGGPVSGFLWVFQEFLALLFSFGVPFLRDIIFVLIMLVTWPLKWLDVIFRHLPTAGNIASSFYYYGQKP